MKSQWAQHVLGKNQMAPSIPENVPRKLARIELEVRSFPSSLGSSCEWHLLNTIITRGILEIEDSKTIGNSRGKTEEQAATTNKKIFWRKKNNYLLQRWNKNIRSQATVSPLAKSFRKVSVGEQRTIENDV